MKDAPGKVDKQLGVTLKNARRYRELTDYDDLVEFDQEDAEEQIQDAEKFLSAIEQLLHDEE